MYTISKIVSDTFLDLMACPMFKSIGNDICDESNNKLLCLYDGGDCREIYNCNSLRCIEEKMFDPCPEYDLIGDGQCNENNRNFICSFDAGDCQTRYVNSWLFMKYLI